MRRIFFFGAAFVLACAGACASYGSATPSPDAGTDGPAPTTDAPADDASSTPDQDAAGDNDAGPTPDSGALFADGFEKGALCAGWTTGNGSVDIKTTTTAPHGGTQSCRVCVNSAGGSTYVAHSIADPGPGTFQATVWIRAETAAAVEVTTSLETGLEIFAEDSSLLPTSTFALSAVQGITKDSADAGEVITYRIILPQPICYDIDDVTLAYAP